MKEGTVIANEWIATMAEQKVRWTESQFEQCREEKKNIVFDSSIVKKPFYLFYWNEFYVDFSFRFFFVRQNKQTTELTSTRSKKVHVDAVNLLLFLALKIVKLMPIHAVSLIIYFIFIGR